MTSLNHIVYLSSDDDEDDKAAGDPDSSEPTSGEKPKSKKRKKTKSTGHRKSNLKVQNDDDDDDDCVVLDCDPYKTTEQATTIDTCAADELLVLGQKGEVKISLVIFFTGKFFLILSI